jgi:hypothetical protein
MIFLSLKLKDDWLKRRVLREQHIKAIQEALSRFLMDQVIDRKGAYYYNPKEVIPRSQTMKD